MLAQLVSLTYSYINEKVLESRKLLLHYRSNNWYYTAK